MRYPTSFFIFNNFCKASKNQEPKKQETKKIDFVRNFRKGKWKKSWKSQFAPKSTYLNLVWTMFYYFIWIVQKLNFAPGWIIQCPFCLTLKNVKSCLIYHSRNFLKKLCPFLQCYQQKNYLHGKRTPTDLHKYFSSHPNSHSPLLIAYEEEEGDRFELSPDQTMILETGLLEDIDSWNNFGADFYPLW